MKELIIMMCSYAVLISAIAYLGYSRAKQNIKPIIKYIYIHDTFYTHSSPLMIDSHNRILDYYENQ